MVGDGMKNYKNTQIIPIALIFIIAVVSIAALVSIARMIFFPGDQNSTTKVDVSQTALLKSSEGHSVKMIVRGPIVANENFYSYEITVSPSSRNFTVLKGYLNDPSSNKTFNNNTVAYEQFVYALDKANLAKGVELTGDKNDLRGICATGYVYQFQILESNKSVKSLWTSSCSGSRGSLSANVKQLMNLFVAQIPDSNNAIEAIW